MVMFHEKKFSPPFFFAEAMMEEDKNLDKTGNQILTFASVYHQACFSET